MLSKKEQDTAIDLCNKISNKITYSGDMSNPKYHDFIKELAKAINRLEGQEVLDILKVGLDKIKLI